MSTHIQIGDIAPRIQYVGDGAQTRFDFPFPIFAEADLEVYLDDALQSVGFTVYEVNESDGGYVIFDAAPATDAVVTMRRWLGISRLSDFQESGELRAEVLNDELDYLSAALQQVSGELERALRLDPTDTATDLELPSATDRANGYLGFDGDGALIAATAPEGGNVVSAYVATLLDDADAPTARTTLGLSIGTDVLAPDGDGSGLSGLPVVHGQCRLEYVSATEIKLTPKDGNQIVIDGAVQTIPGAGVSLANTGLAGDTLYYVYLYDDAGTLTLEANATGHGTHSDGVEIKTADSTRTLVGMIYTEGSTPGQFQPGLMTRTWFSRFRDSISANFTTNRTVTSASLVEIDSEIRCEFLIWADEIVSAVENGAFRNTTAVGKVTTKTLNVDGSSEVDAQGTCSMDQHASGYYIMGGTNLVRADLSEGHHYITLFGSVSASSSGSYRGGVAGTNGRIGISISVGG